MYGFPLTIYVLSGWLQTQYPDIDWFAHDSGHLLNMLFGWEANPHFGPFHLLSFALIFAGFSIISVGCRELYRAQREQRLATGGPSRRVRHPQYVGFILAMTGFLLQWPTLLTLATHPLLVSMYLRLARHEERESEEAYGDALRKYAARTPRFLPSWSGPREHPQH